MLRSIFTFLFLISSFSGSCSDDLYYPTFKEGLCRCERSNALYKKRFKTDQNEKKLAVSKAEEALFGGIYDNAVARIKERHASDELTIPKIIHVIWLGSEIPERYAVWQNSWKAIDGWEYRLWTDKEVADLVMINREIYEASKNFGEKSDILRLELLYQFGGLYVDTDFACFNPSYFEAFHRSLDFYIGFEPLEYRNLNIGNAIIGSQAGHPLLLELINRLPQSFVKNKGYTAVHTTGPQFVTKVIKAYFAVEGGKSEGIAVFPPSFFYPYTRKELKHKGGFLKIRPDDVAQETCAIHFWDGSWGRKFPKN